MMVLGRQSGKLHARKHLVILNSGPMWGPARGRRDGGGRISECRVSFPLKNESQKSEGKREESEK